MNPAELARCREALATGHARVPVVREIILDTDTPVSAFSKLHRGAYGFLLESLEGGERWARYTFLATEPTEVFRYFGHTVEVLTADGWQELRDDTTPLDHVAELVRTVSAPEVPDLPRFTGGVVGFWGYDVVRGMEKLATPPQDDRQLPDAVAMVIDTLLVLDHLFNRAIVIANVSLTPDMSDDDLQSEWQVAESRANEWIDRLRTAPSPIPLLATSAVGGLVTTSPYADEKFLSDVRACQEYIAAGDAFQIVLSRRVDVEPAPDPFTTYRWLRALNPAPYCYYLRLGPLTLAGASPEVLVRVEGDEVTVRPIAGTRPRGKSAEADAQLEAELRSDPKENAEHLMLVDLGRNDVGRVARFGTVQVVAQQIVERYSHVMHLVSEVRGRLRPGLDALDAFAAAFPAGTVSGAPKVRAMQIIDEFEPTRRGPYAGAVGYIGYGARNLDTAIAIRTVAFADGKAWVQAGAGIVADSVPAAELAETVAKAGAVMAALSAAR
jgi:anthranilate synthase component 1